MTRLTRPFGHNHGPMVSGQVRSTASIIAILCAIGSFIMSGRGTESAGFILAIVAILGGVVGGVKALSPRVSGGILSILAVVLGLIALVYAFICVLV